jgi:Xaa-Pro aminopeptidase
MDTMHPTLLVGPADWDPARMPKQEFLGRIAALFAACDPAVAGAIVYGDPRSHAELFYLTHTTPKLEACIALIPRSGAPHLMVGGGANMVGAAKPLTWVETLAPLREAGATIARWRDELGGALALVNGDAMPWRLWQGIERALGAPPADATRLVAQAMGAKSPCELVLVREACAGVAAAFAAMREAQRADRGMTDIVLAGERAAWRRGAQDVRSLFGRRGRLIPFMGVDDGPADPLQVFVAVRHAGYWAEGCGVLSQSPQPAAAAAQAMLGEAIDRIRPSASHREVARSLAQATGVQRAHPVTRSDFGHCIGLALQEPGTLNDISEATFAAGEVYTVRAGLSDGGGASARVSEMVLVSAMVLVTDQGHEVLWRGDDA